MRRAASWPRRGRKIGAHSKPAQLWVAPQLWVGIAGIVGMVAVLGFLTACTSEPAPEEERPSNILLITIDTLRADHLSSYGYKRETSPVLDRLAAEGVRFDQPAAQWPKTGPSFASMFTATYPKDNGIVRKVGVAVPNSFRMLAEELAAQGYSNHAIVSNGALATELRYNQGFETYIETWKMPEAGTDGKGNPASRITQIALDVAAQLDGEKPFFLWVHYIDPHHPYEAPEPWTDKFANDEFHDPERQVWVNPKRRRQQMRGIGYTQAIDGRTDLDYYVARYDAEIAYADHYIGVLLDGLRDAGQMNETLTVVTSDHGESLGEHHYYFGHGRFGFQPGLRVPLIFHQPGVLEPRVDYEPVELLHLAPTLLEVAGVDLNDGRWMQGRSLWARLLGQESPEETPLAFSEAGISAGRNWQRTVRDRRFKLLHAPAGGANKWLDDQAFVLYDLENDPGETVNQAESFPNEARRLKRALDGWWEADKFNARVEGGEEAEADELDEKTVEQLRALGYID